MPNKQLYADIYDVTNTTYINTWLDVIGLPQFQIDGQPGAKQLSFQLARPYGRADAPGDYNSRGSLKNGNRIHLRISDDSTNVAPQQGSQMIVGVAIPGKMIIGSDTGFSKKVFQGTIRQHTYTNGNSLNVESVSIARLMDIPIDDLSPYTLVGDPVQIAKHLVQQYAPDALRWDSRNPTEYTSKIPYSFSISPGPLSNILEEIRRVCGQNWFCYVTPLGTVRFFEANTTTPDHQLIVGVHSLAPTISYDGVNVRKKYTIKYNDGQDKVAIQANDYTSIDPRHEYITADFITNAGTALAYGRNLLRMNSRDVRRGQVTIIDARSDRLRQFGLTAGYDIESIEPGHTIQLNSENLYATVEQQMLVGTAIPGTARLGYAGYGENLVVHAIDWQYDKAVIHFGQAPANSIYDQVRLERRFQQFVNRG